MAWAGLDDRNPPVFVPERFVAHRSSARSRANGLNFHSFLIMLCAEKIPTALDDIISLDIKR